MTHFSAKSVAVSTLLLLVSSFAQAHGVSNAKAVELSLHRMERLAGVLNKIDGDFQTKLQSLSFEVLSHQTEEDPAFKTVAFQYKPGGPDGAQKAVEIVLDEEGRPVSFKEIRGELATGAPVWPGKSAISLTENALHYLLENASQPALAPFDAHLATLSLRPGKNEKGEDVAFIEISANRPDPLVVNKVLRIRIKLDGTYDLIENWLMKS